MGNQRGATVHLGSKATMTRSLKPGDTRNKAEGGGKAGGGGGVPCRCKGLGKREVWKLEGLEMGGSPYFISSARYREDCGH